jgi:hypothetical protein
VAFGDTDAEFGLVADGRVLDGHGRDRLGRIPFRR